MKLYYCLWLCVHTHIYIIDIVKTVHEDYTVLKSKQLGEASLNLVAGCKVFAVNLVGIVIPAKYKVTESMMKLANMHLPARLYCDLSC